MNRDVLKRLVFVVAAVLLAVLFEVFVWGNSLGMGFVMFVVVFLLVFMELVLHFKHIRNKWAFLLLVPIAILCFDIFRLNNNLIVSLGPLFVLGLVFLFCIFLTVRNSQKHNFAFSRIPVVRNVFLTLGGAGKVFADIISPISHLLKSRNTTRMILIGLLVALPIALLFLSLFMGADAIFADWVRNLFDINLEGSFWGKMVRIIIIGVVLSSFFYVVTSEKHDLLEKAVSAVKIDNVISTVVLGIINILFLSFVIFQIKYLFGDSSFVLENGLKFADYARSGFFELAWVIALAGALLTVVYWSMSQHGNSKAVNLLQILLVLQVGVVAASALKRMNLYQDAYGYTVLRLYVEWFIYFVLFVLAFVVVALVIQLEFKKFFYTGLAAGLIALVAVFSVNVDYMIAKKNVERYLGDENKDVELDVSYLRSLWSVDILPVFVDYRREDFGEEELFDLKEMFETFCIDLRNQSSSIFEYNLGRAKALSLKGRLYEIYELFEGL